MPLLLLWESGAHVVHACAVAKTEHQPKRERVAGLPSTLCFQLVAGASVWFDVVWMWCGMVRPVALCVSSHNLEPPLGSTTTQYTQTHTAILALYCVLVPLIIFVTADPPPAAKY